MCSRLSGWRRRRRFFPAQSTAGSRGLRLATALGRMDQGWDRFGSRGLLGYKSTGGDSCGQGFGAGLVAAPLVPWQGSKLEGREGHLLQGSPRPWHSQSWGREANGQTCHHRGTPVRGEPSLPRPMQLVWALTGPLCQGPPHAHPSPSLAGCSQGPRPQQHRLTMGLCPWEHAGS